MTEPKMPEPEPDAQREAWSSPLHEPKTADEQVVLHPRADGEDPDFEALEMEHRGMSAQR
jgi:hypothetical protein